MPLAPEKGYTKLRPGGHEPKRCLWLTAQAAPSDGLRTIDLSELKMGQSFETLYGLWGDAGLDLSQRRPRALYLYGHCDALCPSAFDTRLLHLTCRVPHPLRLL